MVETPATILIVDDHPNNLVALAALLEPLGARVLRALSGEEALEQLLMDEVALAIVDVQMPRMDGLELATAMRSTERTRTVPIIFLTAAAASDQLRFRGYGAGAVDVLFKPVENHVLQSKVSVFLDLHRHRCQLERALETQTGLASQLRLSEERYRLATEAVAGLVYDWDVPTGCVGRSAGLADIVGYAPDEVPATLDWWRERIHQDDVDAAVQKGIATTAAHAPLVQTTYRVRHRAGHWVHVLDQGRVLYKVDGSVERVIGCTVDVTARVKADADLRESEQRFRAMADGLPLIVWAHDADGGQSFVNRTFCEFFGVTADQAHGDQWQMLIHPEDAEAYTQAFVECVRSQTPFHAECRVRGAGGTWRRIESWAQPRYANAAFVGMVGASADVTARAEADARLAASERRFRDVFNHQFQFSALLTVDECVADLCQSALRIFGTSRNDVIGRLFFDLPCWREMSGVLEPWRRCFAEARATLGTVRGDTTYRTADGTLRHAITAVTALRDATGLVECLLVEWVDDTEQRNVAQQLIDANRRKDEFLAMLAHELRNPLAPVRTAIALMRGRAPGDPLSARCQDILDRQVTHMARLLDDLLDVSRLSRGKLTLQRTPVWLSDVLASAVETSRPHIDRQQHELTVVGDASLLSVDGDHTRLSQVFANLLNNAAKYTPPGGQITVEVIAEQATAVVRVKDTGIGLRADDVERVFDLFAQIENGAQHAAGGLGIGLALARRLVEMHGGTISAASGGEGMGADFTVRLPARRLTAGARVAETPEAGHRTALQRHVLIVDDNVDAADTLALLLQEHGCAVRVVYDGSEALRAAESFTPDLVLLDLGLPGVSGRDVCRSLREAPWAHVLHIVAVTGWGDEGQRQRSQREGFDGHLVKPVDVTMLLDVVRRAPQRPRSTACDLTTQARS